MQNIHRWWQKPLIDFSDEEWEALCDGCGLCCLNKLVDSETEIIYLTNVACQQLCLDTGCCKNYANRFKYEPACIKLTKENIHTIPWLPVSCAYRLIREGKPLPNWHPLIVKNSDSVPLAISLRDRIHCKVVYEDEVEDWEDHILHLESL